MSQPTQPLQTVYATRLQEKWTKVHGFNDFRRLFWPEMVGIILVAVIALLVYFFVPNPFQVTKAAKYAKDAKDASDRAVESAYNTSKKVYQISIDVDSLTKKFDNHKASVTNNRAKVEKYIKGLHSSVDKITAVVNEGQDERNEIHNTQIKVLERMDSAEARLEKLEQAETKPAPSLPTPAPSPPPSGTVKKAPLEGNPALSQRPVQIDGKSYYLVMDPRDGSFENEDSTGGHFFPAPNRRKQFYPHLIGLEVKEFSGDKLPESLRPNRWRQPGFRIKDQVFWGVPVPQEKKPEAEKTGGTPVVLPVFYLQT